MESQFGKTDIPFYTGRLTGIRSFNVTPKGELTGITYAGRWTNGENAAKCALSDKSYWDGTDEAPRSVNEDPGHQVASLGCSCGYYAYFDGNDNEYYHGVNVEGLIEAWGKVTIGDKGFRAAQARIVALVIPVDAHPRTPFGKLAHRMSCPADWAKPHAWSYPYLAQEAGCNLPIFPHPSLMDTIVGRYSEAKIFSSLEEAMVEFPPTPVEVANQIVEA